MPHPAGACGVCGGGSLMVAVGDVGDLAVHLRPAGFQGFLDRVGGRRTEIFGKKRWPIENWQGPAGPTGHSEMLYRMGPAIAEWWKDLTH